MQLLSRPGRLSTFSEENRRAKKRISQAEQDVFRLLREESHFKRLFTKKENVRNVTSHIHLLFTLMALN
jgi:hypothetical protein